MPKTVAASNVDNYPGHPGDPAVADPRIGLPLNPARQGRVPVVLAMGMGLDSVAVVTRWLTEPDTRGFDLRDLIVLTAMTGDEYAVTGELMAAHVLPLLQQHRIRYVQVARAGQDTDAGYVVLDDSTSPARMHLRGPWSLADELTAAGTVPQVSSGRRTCIVDCTVKVNQAAPLGHWLMSRRLAWGASGPVCQTVVDDVDEALDCAVVSHLGAGGDGMKAVGG